MYIAYALKQNWYYHDYGCIMIADNVLPYLAIIMIVHVLSDFHGSYEYFVWRNRHW